MTTPNSPAASAVTPGRVLLVDDEPAFQRLGGAFLRNLGQEVTVAGDAEQAVEAFAASRPDLVLLDLAMPPSMDPEQGLALIPRFAGVPVVVLTGHAEHELALRAAELGAWDFLPKPIDPDLLRFVVTRALRKHRLDQELSQLRLQQGEESMGLLGQAPAMQSLRAMIRRVAPSRVNVLVLGPTGTGKELVARALHEQGPQAAGPFVPVHCGALSAELLESELFGHVKGSFTGAYRDQPGLVEVARGGTLFLDEVGEMPLPMQVKLLRFLQEGSFMPVGGRATKTSEVRVVAATHRDLEAMVRSGEFREDLYYRLKGVVLRTPALAERRQDVPLLAVRFAQLRGVGVSASAMAWLSACDWPGNVRELKAVVEASAALLLPGQHELDAEALSLAAGAEMPAVLGGAAASHPGTRGEQDGLLDAALAELERRLISEAMQGSGGNQSEAARRLGISRVGLIKKLGRLGLR
ncbi:two-component system, NtrC family, response regulator [Roseateles sp. YR242]|uniref:sigma-54-dependent transcriptional regulator n=1 Tax=Roseateles sp. YR242 TaxID=1855305 RepID=UPI0008B1B4A6|nr:sigma-54 dependent transcriptional regulator [Roseateles sp. YR242]SEL10794.1 two-component system, NtrC family, response regulator [Roseateles sp. YR242]